MTNRRGFVNYDIYLAAFGVLLLVALIVPSCARAVTKSKLRGAEYAALRDIANAEHTAFATNHRYTDSVAAQLDPRVHLVSLRGDSAGWGALVASDTINRIQLTCGLYEGPASFAPDSAVTEPSRVSCR